MGQVGFRDDHETRGILVQPVHDAGASHSANSGKARAAMRDQRIDQCAGAVTGSRMHDQAFRLVDDDDGVVFVDNIEWNFLALRFGRLRGWKGDRYDIAGFDGRRRIADRACTDLYLARNDQGLQPRSRQRRKVRGKNAIDPHPRFIFGDGDGFAGAVCHGLCEMADTDEKRLDPEAARVVAQARRLMITTTLTTFIAVAAVLGVIGYRFFKAGERAQANPDVSAALPPGAKILSSAVGDGKVVLTVEANGAIELLSFDLGTLRPLARARLKPP